MIDRELLIELARRAELAKNRPDVLGSTFSQQRAFIEDPARLKAVFCTRRAAKSFSAGLALCHAALSTPESDSLFIGLTKDSARRIIWNRILKVIDRVYGLNASFNETLRTMTFSNGSTVYIAGADVDEDEMNKLLGGKYKLVCIDEASMYTIDLHNMVYGILKPAMTDMRGTICLMGTSSNFARGLFFDITTGKEPGWSLHQWSAHDNPYVAKQWQEELDEIARERPLYMQTPQFKQWYLNMWEVDETKRCYRFDASKNLVKELPKPKDHSLWSVVLGVDLGWEDDNAFVLMAYHQHDPHLYVLSSYAKKRMTFDEVTAKIQEYMRDTVWGPNKVVIDGANKQGVESMRQRSAIPFEYADKQDKATFIELCNGDLVQTKIKVLDTPENRPLWEEMLSLVWETDGDKIKLPKKEHPNLPNHRCDAFLYGWRMGYHYHWGPAEVVIPKYSPAWYEKQAEDIWEREREKLQEVNQGGSWPSEEW